MKIILPKLLISPLLFICCVLFLIVMGLFAICGSPLIAIVLTCKILDKAGSKANCPDCIDKKKGVTNG